ncbi:MAG: UDP-glucose/GDP-mannose dehydrogenase family protein, partial [Planctomycetaceae bacterium]|nr:UDP-glucose/GDP-mannose dehydrogenase family protein [Planctomycetaceae bacterium]
VDDVNDAQKEILFQKISKYFGNNLAGKTIAIWGLAFKPRTDDIREAPSLVLISQLLQAGAKVQAYDPVAMPNVKAVFGGQVQFLEKQYDALSGADALAIVTEWGDFRVPNFELMKQKLKQQVIFDGRNLYEPEQVRKLGFYYSGIGLHGDDYITTPKTL